MSRLARGVDGALRGDIDYHVRARDYNRGNFRGRAVGDTELEQLRGQKTDNREQELALTYLSFPVYFHIYDLSFHRKLKGLKFFFFCV